MGLDVRLGWDHPNFARLHPQRFQKLPHLRGLAHNPGQRLNPGGRFRDGRRRPLLKLGLNRRAVVVESTAGPTRLEVLELLNASGHVGFEERFKGSLEVGKAADLVVLAEDLS